MPKRIILAGLLTLISISSFAQKEIIGYYATWKYYERSNLMKPSNLKWDRVTMINYAFFAPDANGYLSGTDAWADTILLRGEHDWSNGGYIPNTSLIDLAHQNDVKVLVSIGGWTLSDNFPGIAASTTKTKTFADECVRLIKQYGFDGIDIDWEYPGFATHNGTPADKQNFTKFMTVIRNALNELTNETGQYYYLTAAVSASPSHVQNLELDKLVEIMDMFNVMTYDFSGTWDQLSGHNSPLYQGHMPNAAYNFDAAFRLYHETYNVPAEKINLGIAFYGRSFKDCTGPNSTHTGPDLANFPNDNGTPMYHEIMAKMNLFQRNWDDQSQVPYLTGKGFNSYVTYDDEESICRKASYVNSVGAGGVLIWEISGDYLDVNTTPLQDVLYKVLIEKSSCGSTVPVPFIDLNAMLDQQDVLISWSVGQEDDADYFEVETVYDTINFTNIETLGTVDATLSESYSYRDLYPPSGERYYRIKKVSATGEITYSSIVTIEVPEVLKKREALEDRLRIYPNPAAGENMFLDVPEELTGAVISLYNISGSVVYTNIPVMSGQSRLSDLVPSLEKGIYILEIKNSEHIVRKKLVIK